MSSQIPSRRWLLGSSAAALAALALRSPSFAQAPASPATAPVPLPASLPVFDVERFGAVIFPSDAVLTEQQRQTVSTAAIQRAIDACHSAGGGIVYLSHGLVLSGTLELKSNVTLYVEAGATLLGSSRIEDYTPQNLIMARGARNIAIAGPGTIDGQGHAFWKKLESGGHGTKRRKFAWCPTHSYDHAPKRSGKMIRLEGCTGVRVTGVSLANAESWTLHLLGCDDVLVDGVRIRNPLHGPNTDGIDVEACQNVRIANCDIYTGDDAIVLKNRNKDHLRACRNITITNCILTTVCNAIKIGTESFCDFENIVASNCIIKAGLPDEPLCIEAVKSIDPEHYGDALAPLGGIAIETVDGANVRGVSVSNIVMTGVRAPIFVRLGHRGIHPVKKDQKSPVGTLQDISISDITARGASCASSITGIPNHLVRNVRLQNVRVTSIGAPLPEWADIELPEKESAYPDPTMWGPTPCHGLFVRHAAGLQLRDVSFAIDKPDNRPAMICNDVIDLRIDHLQTPGSPTARREIDLRDVRQATLRGSSPAAGTKTWIRLSGAACKDVLILPDTTRDCEKPLERDDSVPASEATLRALDGR